MLKLVKLATLDLAMLHLMLLCCTHNSIKHAWETASQQ